MNKHRPPKEFLRPQHTTEADSVSETRLPEFSDEALALAFANQYAGTLRYVATWKRWFIWSGSHWVYDDTMCAFDRARQICRESAARCDTGARKGIASATTAAAVERLAKADRRHAGTVDQWDCDPWLLNTPSGVVNLKTGITQLHRPDDYMTKITVAAPGGECPKWRVFLKRITGDDQALASFLQRLAGYCLTGSTREHALAFLYGLGANGKSVFLNTIAGILGSYQRTAPIETFTTSNSDRHPTELAMLRGARLVTAVETEEGRHWAEARIKTLTGGDRISARFMRADFFEYDPQFKLLIAGNHRPGLRSVDEAIRRRFHLIPFTVTIPKAEQEQDLADNLRTEWPGILQWMIDGCLAWQRDGLKPPPVVMDATAAYLEAEDAAAAWVMEACERVPSEWTSSADLYASWTSWAERTGEFVGSRKRFSQALERRGFESQRRGDTRGFLGIGIKAPIASSFEGDR